MPLDSGHNDEEDGPNFLFVNADSQTLTQGQKDRDLHREKQAHIQRKAYKLRRQGTGSQAKSPTQILAPRTAEAEAASTGVEKRHGQHEHIQIANSSGRPSVARQTSNRGRFTWRLGTAPSRQVRKATTTAQPKDTETHAEQASRTAPSPLVIYNKGNSDPFLSTVVAIDPEIGELLNFNGTFVEPFIMSMEKGEDRSASYLNKMYQDPAMALHDERTAHATIARLAILRTTIAENAASRDTASSFIVKAYAETRVRLNSPGMNEDLAIRVLALLSYEILARNFVAAATHAKILHGLLLSLKSSRHNIDSRLLKSVFFMDMQLSLLSWKPPIIVIEDILPSEALVRFPTMIDNLEREGFLVQKTSEQFHGTGIPAGNLLDEFLLTLLLFRIGMVINNSEKWKRLFAETTAGVWAVAWAINIQHIIQIYFRAKEEADMVGSTHVQKRKAAISLAMLYWNYTGGNFDLILPTRVSWRQMAPIWSPTEHMLAELDHCINEIDWDNDRDAIPELRFWLLYICTLAEQVVVNINDLPFGWLCKHHLDFVACAQDLGLRSWDDVSRVLEGYAFVDGLSTLSQSWFYACLDTSKDEVAGLLNI